MLREDILLVDGERGFLRIRLCFKTAGAFDSDARLWHKSTTL